jgi:hypothetical protein
VSYITPVGQFPNYFIQRANSALAPPAIWRILAQIPVVC